MNNQENEIKNRRAKGEGGLRQLNNGNWEGIEKIKKESGEILSKSITRKSKQEVLLIKRQLKALEPLDNDIVKIEVDKITNKIILIKNPILNFNIKEVDKNTTVNEYVDYWLWNYRKKGMKGKLIKDGTFEDYVQKCDYIKQKLGTIKNENGKIMEVKVADLTFEFMEKAILELNEKIKTVSVRQIRNHLYNMMACAKKDGIIKNNPFQDRKINLPSCSGEKVEKKVIKEEDTKNIIQYCVKLWYVDVITQLVTGARVSEIRGLTWEDIIEKENIIKFSQSYNSVKQFKYQDNQIVSLGRKRRYSTLKSENSYREIEIPEEYMKLLMFHKQRQKELAKKLGKIFRETDAVFTTNTYTPLGRNDTNDRVKKVAEDLKIENWEEITSHCLRHSFCYTGLLNDIPLEYMQILLGHSDISVTRKWYAHFDKKKLIHMLEKLIKVGLI